MCEVCELWPEYEELYGRDVIKIDDLTCVQMFKNHSIPMKCFLDTATLLLLQIILSVTPVLEIALARYYSSAKIRDIG